MLSLLVRPLEPMCENDGGHPVVSVNQGKLSIQGDSEVYLATQHFWKSNMSHLRNCKTKYLTVMASWGSNAIYRLVQRRCVHVANVISVIQDNHAWSPCLTIMPHNLHQLMGFFYHRGVSAVGQCFSSSGPALLSTSTVFNFNTCTIYVIIPVSSVVIFPLFSPSNVPLSLCLHSHFQLSSHVNIVCILAFF